MPNPKERSLTRREQTAQRLRDALHRLATGTAIHPSNKGRKPPFSVSALAREAGVARNAVYTNHRFAIDALSGLTRPQNEPDHSHQTMAIQKLATENAILLKRAIDAEKRADRLERRCAALLKRHDESLALVSISTQVRTDKKVSYPQKDKSIEEIS